MEHLDLDYKALSLMSPEQVRKFRVVPLSLENGHITLLAEANGKVNKIALQMLLGKEVFFKGIDKKELERLIYKHYPLAEEKAAPQKTNPASDSDVIRFLSKIMEEAAQMGVSDIHIERYEKQARVRFRFEGRLLEKYEVPLEQYNAIVSRIKILAELDISERRLPQDGRIKEVLGGKEIDIRVSTLPTKFGEKVVMRLLTRSEENLILENLNFPEAEFQVYKKAIAKPNGIILITGPTGSGKTTTLYATLNRLNTPDTNILSIEDPIEYNLSGINQVQLKEEIGLTFDRALRAFLRQDPNILMIGEIRDTATARIAIRASLAGRLVFSTLHTNSSLDSLTRLRDMGIEPYLLASALRLVLAQRLVRLLCNECKSPSTEVLLPEFQAEHGIKEHYVANACPSCFYTGFKGRQAIFEALPMSPELKSFIRAGEGDLDNFFSNGELRSLEQNFAQLVKEGKTSLSESMAINT